MERLSAAKTSSSDEKTLEKVAGDMNYRSRVEGEDEDSEGQEEVEDEEEEAEEKGVGFTFTEYQKEQ